MKNKDNEWEPKVITVPLDFNTNFEILPDFIPVIVRANYIIK